MLTSKAGDPSSGGKGSSLLASSLLKMASPLKRFMNLLDLSAYGPNDSLINAVQQFVVLR